MPLSNIREGRKNIWSSIEVLFAYTNILEGWINGHEERGRSKKTFIEETIRQVDCY